MSLKFVNEELQFSFILCSIFKLNGENKHQIKPSNMGKKYDIGLNCIWFLRDLICRGALFPLLCYHVDIMDSKWSNSPIVLRRLYSAMSWFIVRICFKGSYRYHISLNLNLTCDSLKTVLMLIIIMDFRLTMLILC